MTKKIEKKSGTKSVTNRLTGTPKYIAARRSLGTEKA